MLLLFLIHIASLICLPVLFESGSITWTLTRSITWFLLHTLPNCRTTGRCTELNQLMTNFYMYSGRMFELGSTSWCVDATLRRWAHRWMLYVSTDLAAALSTSKMGRRPLQLHHRYRYNNTSLLCEYCKIAWSSPCSLYCSWYKFLSIISHISGLTLYTKLSLCWCVRAIGFSMYCCVFTNFFIYIFLHCLGSIGAPMQRELKQSLLFDEYQGLYLFNVLYIRGL